MKEVTVKGEGGGRGGEIQEEVRRKEKTITHNVQYREKMEYLERGRGNGQGKGIGMVGKRKEERQGKRETECIIIII